MTLQSDPGRDSVACFITPHGYGHAARCCAVVESLGAIHPELDFDLFTTTPEWFFRASLTVPFRLHPCVSDVGLIQKTSLLEDPEATLRTLDETFPPSPHSVSHLADQLRSNRCVLVLCDISPLGLSVASAAEIPSALVENFTWDWIYEGYQEAAPGLARHRDWLAATYDTVDLRIQAEPFCREMAGAARVPPISRASRRGKPEIRHALDVPPDAPLVLVTMGGLSWEFGDLAPLRAASGAVFVIPGASDEVERAGNLRLLPHHSDFYHPDLVQAADLVVGKLGYSTVAEAYHGGTSYLWVPRPEFAESQVLARFVEANLGAARISAEDFSSGRWIKRIGDVLEAPRTPTGPNGARVAAEMLSDWLRRPGRGLRT